MTVMHATHLLGFLTPVRGHAFSSRPPGRPAPLRRGAPARLVREPDNPADALAVAVWTGARGADWRIGYLERAVAARLAPRIDDGQPLRVTLAGWWDEPEGRWRRPVVAIEPDEVRDHDAPLPPPRPATSVVRPVGRRRHTSAS